MNVDPIWIYGGGAVFAILFSELRGYKRRCTSDLARRAIGTYLTTGTKTEALGLNSRTTIEAAEQHRLRYLKVPIVPFEAFCVCPKCGEFSCHTMLVGNVNLKTLSRVCDCGFMWKQWR